MLYLNLEVDEAAARGGFGVERYEKKEMQLEVCHPVLHAMQTEKHAHAVLLLHSWSHLAYLSASHGSMLFKFFEDFSSSRCFGNNVLLVQRLQILQVRRLYKALSKDISAWADLDASQAPDLLQEQVCFQMDSVLSGSGLALVTPRVI